MLLRKAVGCRLLGCRKREKRRMSHKGAKARRGNAGGDAHGNR